MRYLITDLRNIVKRSAHVAKKADSSEERAAFALHLALHSIASAWKIHDANHLVVCDDGRSWRKDFYKPYKANREAKKSDMTLRDVEDEQCLSTAHSDLVSFLATKTNATVLYSPLLEADDLVQGWIAEHPDDYHIINSSDSDFYQLLSENVIQYNGITGETHSLNGIIDIDGRPVIDKKTQEPKAPPEPKWLLFEKCVRGDTSDNIFSAYPKVRVKGTKNTVGIRAAFDDSDEKGFEYNTFMNQVWKDHLGNDHIVKDDFQRNKTLIDLTAQPPEVRAVITETVRKSTLPSEKHQIGAHFLKFCGKYQLDKIADNPTSIVKIISSSYKGKA